MLNTDVLIAGGGPVGLTLAIALGQRNVRVCLVEKKAQPEFLPKMERTNARSMEMFRRLGLADRIRAASEYTPLPTDIFLVTALNEPPILRLLYPSVPEAKKQIEQCRGGVARR
jgi:flavin-dependent dehydrogenase